MSDEATSLVMMDLTDMVKAKESKKDNQQDTEKKKTSPITIEEAIQNWKRQWNVEVTGENKKREGAKVVEEPATKQGTKTLIQDTEKGMIVRKTNAVEGKQIITKEDGGYYYVELAEEEENERGLVDMEVEKKLIQEVTKKLSIKRRREEQGMLFLTYRGEDEDQEVSKAETSSKKIKQSEEIMEDNETPWERMIDEEFNTDKAEEAGRHMPHQKHQWLELTSLGGDSGRACLFIEDFNDVINQEEKQGLHPKPREQVEAFREFINKNGVMDIDLKGGGGEIHLVQQSEKWDRNERKIRQSSSKLGMEETIPWCNSNSPTLNQLRSLPYLSKSSPKRKI
ncbi:hypothetical protein PIB30_099388 [Stylosanthes scabra]|uniref:Uncharacterized protein n=1 Tax=Stylosanthes scabra TaxID=79078 RepID=A0ABU6UWB5_9FABA|nr:hypothetical protein [Stylosanthes scabra]